MGADNARILELDFYVLLWKFLLLISLREISVLCDFRCPSSSLRDTYQSWCICICVVKKRPYVYVTCRKGADGIHVIAITVQGFSYYTG